MPAAAAVETVIHVVAELHERGQRTAKSLFVADDRAVTGISHRLIELTARHHPGFRHAVRTVFGIPASQDGEPLEPGRHVRTNFGKLHAGDGRVDRSELASHAHRRIGLGIERVMMTRAAVRPDQNAIHIREVVAACADLARKNVGSDIPKPAKAPTARSFAAKSLHTFARNRKADRAWPSPGGTERQAGWQVGRRAGCAKLILIRGIDQ